MEGSNGKPQRNMTSPHPLKKTVVWATKPYLRCVVEIGTETVGVPSAPTKNICLKPSLFLRQGPMLHHLPFSPALFECLMFSHLGLHLRLLYLIYFLAMLVSGRRKIYNPLNFVKSSNLFSMLFRELLEKS